LKNQIIIQSPNSGRISEIRETFRNRMEKLYEGWSDEYDKQWDEHSFHLAYKEGNNYLATCRLIVKRYNEIEFTTPMEQADISNYKIPANYKNCVEGGMVSFSSISALKILMLYACDWLLENKFNYLVTCYDVNNKLIEKLYMNVLGLVKVDRAVLKYSGFINKKDKNIVAWQVVDGDVNKEGLRIKEALSKELNIDTTGFSFPSVQEWLKEEKTKVVR